MKHAYLREGHENEVKITNKPCTSCMERGRCRKGNMVCKAYIDYSTMMQSKVIGIMEGARA